MNKGLRNYLARCTPAVVDPAVLADLQDAMQQAVPEIVEAIKQREQRAAEIRRDRRPLF